MDGLEQNTASQHRPSGQEEEDDELDALLERYEQQAAADVAAVARRQQGRGGGGGTGNSQEGRKRPKLSAAHKREEALNQPISADNKGFKLLSAMGYQQGQAIGRSGTGLAEPLPLLLKQNKLGLGAVSKKAAAREQQRQHERDAEQRAAAAAAAAEANHQGQRLEYQQRAAAAAGARRLEGQLRKAQQVCETLDTAAGISRCVMWRAPPAAAAAAASSAAMEAAAAADDLLEQCELCHSAEAGAAVKAAQEEAADFARLYEWQAAVATGAAAGGKLPSEGAVQLGDAQIQQQQREEQQSEQDEEELREWEAWQALPPANQLAAVLARLRELYCYCLYCGCRYDSAVDMQQHCPGPSEADHE